MIHLCCVFSLLQSLPWEDGSTASVSALPQNASVARQPSSRCSVCAHAVKSVTATLRFCVSWMVSAHIHILDWLQFRPGYFFSLSIVTKIKRIFQCYFSELPKRKTIFRQIYIPFPLWKCQSFNQQVRLHFIKWLILIQKLRWSYIWMDCVAIPGNYLTYLYFELVEVPAFASASQVLGVKAAPALHKADFIFLRKEGERV